MGTICSPMKIDKAIWQFYGRLSWKWVCNNMQCDYVYIDTSSGLGERQANTPVPYEDRQCTYNLTLRRVHVTTAAVEKKCLTYLCVCVRARIRVWVSTYVRVWVYGRVGVCMSAWNLTYPACNTHVLYCLRPLWLHQVFRHYLINGMIFGKVI